MKRINPINTSLLAAALASVGSLASAQAGSFFADFDSGLPANTSVFGSATVAGAGGVNGSGCLQLTDTGTDETGVFIITSDLDSGTPVVSFTASFKMTVGGTAGDGFSFNFANDLDLTGNWGVAEEGNGTGLTIEFDTFPNGSPDTAPSIDVKLGGTEVATAPAQLVTSTGNYVDVVIQLNPDRTLTVIYDGVYAYKNLNVSASLTSPTYPFTGALFGIGARNGSNGGTKFADNLNIVTQTNAAPFVLSVAPLGRRADPSSAIDITLTNFNTQVNSGSIVLQLDGATVSPTVTSASDKTFIHFAPASAFGPYTAHSVSLAFADNATPTPKTHTVQYGFSIPATSFITRFTDGFEGYTGGGAALDKNTTGPNAAPNGSGNPWFGPLPPNLHVVGTEGSVSPHSGSQMVRGNLVVFDRDQVWYNLAYRLNGGFAYSGNIMMDWYFYDPLGSGGDTFRDFAALGFYNLTPGDTDYPGAGSLNSSGQIQRLSLGASSVQDPGFDNTKYQARVVGAKDGYSSAGWFNTPTTRSVGWHHGRIIVGPTLAGSLCNNVDFYIDDMTNPTFSHVDALAYGYNVLELNANYDTTTTTSADYDDITFAVGKPPNLAVTLSGNNAILAWPGLDFTLQSNSDLTNPLGWTDVTGATSPYSYDITSNPQQFFRLRNSGL